MKHPRYLEDFAVCLRELSLLTSPGVTAETMLRLSRADRKTINALAEQVQVQRLGLTSKQSDMLKLLVKKYTKQLTTQHQVNVGSVDSAPLLFPVRSIDYSKTLTLEGDYLYLKFLYAEELIEKLRDSRMASGTFGWNSEIKKWKIAATEPYVEFAVEFAKAHNFQIQPEVIALYDVVKSYREENAHQTWLELQSGGRISFAPEELTNALQKNEINTLVKLCDKAYLYKYSISNAAELAAQEEIKKYEYYDYFSKFMMHEVVTIPETDLNKILTIATQYCKLVDRGPIILSTQGVVSRKLIDEFNIISIVDVTDFTQYIKTNQIICSRSMDAYSEHTAELLDKFQTARTLKDAFIIENITSFWSLYRGPKGWLLKA